MDPGFFIVFFNIEIGETADETNIIDLFKSLRGKMHLLPHCYHTG